MKSGTSRGMGADTTEAGVATRWPPLPTAHPPIRSLADIEALEREPLESRIFSWNVNDWIRRGWDTSLSGTSPLLGRTGSLSHTLSARNA